MDEDRVTGAAQEVVGKVQDAIGGFAGDAGTQIKGKYNQVAGQAENAAGQLSDIIREQPLAAVLCGVGVGYLIGRLRLI